MSAGSFVDAAPALFAAGLNVVPCDAATKMPLCAWHRFQRERQTVQDLDRLRRDHPGADTAVIMGGPELSLCDLDVDGHDGERALSHLRLPLPPTATFESPRGVHRLYRAAGPVPSHIGLRCHLDVLGRGRYVVTPPSVGRRWRLDFAHLTDLPNEWALFLRSHTRRAAATATLPLREADLLTPSPHSQDSEQGGEARSTRADLASSRADLASSVLRLGSPAFAAVAAALGVPAELGRTFRCPLPGHEERAGSVEWWEDAGGEIVLVDFHRRGTEQGDVPPCYTIPEVFAAVRSGRTRKLSRVAHAMWAERCLQELGLRPPAPVVLPPVHPDAGQTVLRVHEAVRLLFQVRWSHDYGAPAPIAWRFVAAWSGVGERQVGEAIRELLRAGVIRRAGTWRRTALFLPGAPPAPGRAWAS